MSLRSQLEELLPELLPSDPAQAIKGTELIRLVRLSCLLYTSPSPRD